MLQILRKSRVATLLGSANYGAYVLGNSINLVGTWMHWVAVGWLAWQLTKSPFWLGLIAFVDLFPTVIIGPVAGAYADRWNRLNILKTCQWLALIQSLFLFGLTISGQMEPVYLLLLTFALGIVSAFNQPARLSLISNLVPAENLSSAVGLNSVVFNVARFIGPMIAGLIILKTDIAWVFAVNALTFVFFIATLSRIELIKAAQAGLSNQKMLNDLKEGVQFAFTHGSLTPLIVLFIIFTICLRPYTEMLPAFVDLVFSGGAPLLAVFTSTFAGGAIAGGLWLTQRRQHGNLDRIVFHAAYAAVFAVFGFLLSASHLIALPFIALGGCAFVIFGAGVQTLMQLHTPDKMRGRVLSLYGLILRGGPAIGALIVGWAAEVVGVKWPLAVGGVVIVIATEFTRRWLTTNIAAYSD